MADTSARRLFVRCHGGLGNQIFQYAAGLYFAERASLPIEVLRPPGRPEALRSKGFARPFQLDEFSLRAKTRATGWVDRFYLSTKPVFQSMQSKVCAITKTQVIEEPSTNRFLPDLVDQVQARTIYLKGYWQAAGYADALADRLRDSLKIRSELHPQNRHYAEIIRALKCPVSVHIRVGDYALHTTTESNCGKQVTWVLRKSYYREAIARIRTLLPQADLVVFSDDAAGAQAMMDGEPASLWVKGNSPATAFEELWLMSCCKHHVIANSSFSWWGGWMNPDPNKTIIAPKYWLNTQDSYYPELFLPSWSVIDNLA